MNYRDNTLDPYVNPTALQIANRDHDDRLRAEGVTQEGRVRSAWDTAKLVRRGVLTDKKIRAYAKAGYYSAEYKAARKKLMDKKTAQHNFYNATQTFTKRGNFIERDGRLIYAP